MRGLISRIRYFFRDRYGLDDLGRTMICVYIVLLFCVSVVNLFVDGIAMLAVRIFMMLLALMIIFRITSKNIYKRQRENLKYKEFTSKIRQWFKLQKSRYRDRKTHVYKKCPDCRAVLRLKKISGSHRAVCPRCSCSFEVFVR